MRVMWVGVCFAELVVHPMVAHPFKYRILCGIVTELGTHNGFYTEATERSPTDSEDHGAQDCSLSPLFINPTSPYPIKLPLVSINQPKALVASGGNYVGITTKMRLKRAAGRLQGNTRKYPGLVTVATRVRCGRRVKGKGRVSNGTSFPRAPYRTKQTLDIKREMLPIKIRLNN